MKFTLLLLLSTIAFAQPRKPQEHYYYFSSAIDIRNAIVGSPPTNDHPELDLLFQAGIVSQNIEINIGYERFQAISFDKMTFGAGYHFPLYAYPFGHEIKTVLVPSLEPTIINRWGNEWECKSSHLTIGANIGLRWHFTDYLAGELLYNALPRIDLKARYPTVNPTIPIVNSIYAKIIYKF
jgi:hypothetical protein